MDPEITDAPDAVALVPGEVRGGVRLRRVSFRYPTTALVPALAGDPNAVSDEDAAASVAAATGQTDEIRAAFTESSSTSDEVVAAADVDEAAVETLLAASSAGPSPVDDDEGVPGAR